MFLSCGFVRFVRCPEEKPEQQQRGGTKKNHKKGEGRESTRKTEKKKTGKDEKKKRKKEEKRGKANIPLLTQQPANGFTFRDANDMAPCGKAHAESQFAKS